MQGNQGPAQLDGKAEARGTKEPPCTPEKAGARGGRRGEGLEADHPAEGHGLLPLPVLDGLEAAQGQRQGDGEAPHAQEEAARGQPAAGRPQGHGLGPPAR